MTSILTSFLPLTTTFTAAADCWKGPWIVAGGPTAWWKQGGDNVTSCFPSAFPFSLSSIVYLPGICPAGWTSACNREATSSGQAIKVVSCCPSSYKCAPAGNTEHDWETQLGCASPYSVDTAVWSLKSDDTYVNSMYQLQVMIAEATTSISSALSTPQSSPRPASPATALASTTSAPLADTTSTSTSVPADNGGLSKGAIAGIVVGAVLLLAIIVLVVWMLRKKPRTGADSIPIAQPYWDHPAELQDTALDHNLPTNPTEMDATGQRHELKAN